MWRTAVASVGLVLAAPTLITGCTVTCGANPDKLAALRRGMSYEETALIMGCLGTVVSPHSPLDGEAATFEWGGPGSHISTRTQIDFLDGNLLSYTTEQRGGM